MKKTLIFALCGLLMSGISCAQSLNKHVSSNLEYQRKAIHALLNSDYKKIQITGQVSGYCTIARGDFDWDAAKFIGTKKNGSKDIGVVCGNKIYLK